MSDVSCNNRAALRKKIGAIINEIQGISIFHLYVPSRRPTIKEINNWQTIKTTTIMVSIRVAGLYIRPRKPPPVKPYRQPTVDQVPLLGVNVAVKVIELAAQGNY